MTDLILEKVKLKDIKEYENNANEHPQEHVEEIRDSILDFGYLDVIVDVESRINGDKAYLTYKITENNQVRKSISGGTVDEIFRFKLVKSKVWNFFGIPNYWDFKNLS